MKKYENLYSVNKSSFIVFSKSVVLSIFEVLSVYLLIILVGTNFGQNIEQIKENSTWLFFTSDFFNFDVIQDTILTYKKRKGGANNLSNLCIYVVMAQVHSAYNFQPIITSNILSLGWSTKNMNKCSIRKLCYTCLQVF